MKIYRHKDRQTEAYISSKEKFMDRIKKSWDITDPNARNAFLNDSCRTPQAKKEDLGFYDDNFRVNPTRKWCMGGEDQEQVLSSFLTQEAIDHRRRNHEEKEKVRREREVIEREERSHSVSVNFVHEMIVDDSKNNNEG